MPLVIELPEQIEQLMKLEADRKGVSVEAYAARLTTPYERAITELQEALHGPSRPFDPAAIRARYSEKFSIEIPDLSHLSAEELAEQADAALKALTLEQIAEVQRQRLLP